MLTSLKSIPPKIIIFAIITLVLLGSIGSSIYFYLQSKKLSNIVNGPQQSANKEAQDVLLKVGALIELPANENPTIATVSDITKLQGQPFFVHAKVGDKVLVYAQARKIILYRPSINKLVDVSVINLTNKNQEPGAVAGDSVKAPETSETSSSNH